MSLQKIMEDWSVYDGQKIQNQQDKKIFSCDELWEAEHLTDRIRKAYPDISVARIVRAIEQCCTTMPGPKPREEFVRCVLRQLEVVK